MKKELFNKIQKPQDKALDIINFPPNTALVSEIYKTSKIIKLSMAHCKICYWWKTFEKQTSTPPLNFFRKTTEQLSHWTRSALKNFEFVEEAYSKSYEIDSIRYQAVNVWSKLQSNIATDLTELSRMKVKSSITEHILKLY